jgi:hypothetical protein
MKASAAEDLATLYDHQGEDVIFSSFLSGFTDPLDDEQLAELIELDGRKRLVRGLAVPLERYLSAVPDLRGRSNALDAAIEVSLRWLARSSRVDQSAVDQLSAQYPELAEPIREAASLNNALWSTTGLRDAVAGRTTKSLPSDFGPLLQDGAHRYVLRALLGIGATGQVYLAVDRQMSEPGHEALVAVKILPRQDTTILQRVRLADEATKARRIDHPNVVRVIDRGTSEDLEDFIVCEYVEGSDLGAWLQRRNGEVVTREAVALAAAIARGVQAAHSAGLVHCDLKPSNVLMTRDGQPKVTDFGIAMRAHEAEDELRGMERERPIGNLAFISPEQYRMEEGAFSAPSDIYALGGVLYLLLTRRLPNGESVEEIARHHARRGLDRGPVRFEGREVDRDLAAICRRALEPDPRKRYSAAGSLADDLEMWLRAEPLYWTRPSLPRVARLWVRRQPMAAALLLILLGSLVIAGGVVQHLRSRAIVQAARVDAITNGVVAVGKRILHAAETRPPTTRLLETGWMHFYLTQSDYLPTPVDDPAAARAKFTLLERWVAQLDEAGLGDSINAAFMKKTLAFWMIGEGEVERALDLVMELRDILATELRAAGSDPWWADLDCLELLARARNALKNAGASAELADLVPRLVDQAERLDATDRGAPFHLAVLDALEEGCGPQRLHDEGVLRMVTRMRAAIEEDLDLTSPESPSSDR